MNALTLVDWEESRRDYLCLDVAVLPEGRHEDRAAYTASVAWEAFICRHVGRDYSLRRFNELRALLSEA